MIRTLDQTLTYEVDQIRIVLPDEVEDLKIEEGKDLCTPGDLVLPMASILTVCW